MFYGCSVRYLSHIPIKSFEKFLFFLLVNKPAFRVGACTETSLCDFNGAYRCWARWCWRTFQEVTLREASTLVHWSNWKFQAVYVIFEIADTPKSTYFVSVVYLATDLQFCVWTDLYEIYSVHHSAVGPQPLDGACLRLSFDWVNTKVYRLKMNIHSK